MKDFRELYTKAWQAGVEAATGARVVAMTVQQRSNVLDNNSPVVQSWHVPDGVCGFAWIQFKGNSAFAKWCKAQPDIRLSNGYPTGKTIWISDYNQSMQRKEAHANAMAAVLRAGGVDCYAQSRMD